MSMVSDINKMQVSVDDQGLQTAPTPKEGDSDAQTDLFADHFHPSRWHYSDRLCAG